MAHGPLNALANVRIHSPDVLVGQENWEYWTDPTSNWIEGMMRAHRPRWKRKMYLEKLSRQDHATGIELTTMSLMNSTSYSWTRDRDFIHVLTSSTTRKPWSRLKQKRRKTSDRYSGCLGPKKFWTWTAAGEPCLDFSARQAIGGN